MERAESHADGFDPVSGTTTPPPSRSSFWLVNGHVLQLIAWLGIVSVEMRAAARITERDEK